MKCPRCGVDAIIDAGGYKVTGDGSQETPTRLFRVLAYRCRNKSCADYEKNVGKEEIELPIDSNFPRQTPEQ